jgi:membrane-associated phospholipid phosphatase
MRVLLFALVLLNPIERLDWAVARSVQGARRPGLEAPMRTTSSVARPALVLGGLAAVLAVDLAGGAGWSTIRLAVVSLAGTNLLVESLKRIVNRQRPDGEHKRSNASFPSSHAANAFALAWVLRARWRRAGLPFYGLALLVAFSRLYLNRHFLSDVVAGALIAVAVSWLASRWLPLRPCPMRGPTGAPAS